MKSSVIAVSHQFSIISGA